MPATVHPQHVALLVGDSERLKHGVGVTRNAVRSDVDVQDGLHEVIRETSLFDLVFESHALCASAR